MRDQRDGQQKNRGDSGMSWALRLLPSVTDLVMLFPVLFVMLKMQGVSTLLGDGDTGWHIRTGEWILQNGAVPHSDIFSFSKPGQPWFAWEWAWDLSFAWVHRAAGLPAVVFVNLALLGVISVALFVHVRRSCSNDIIATLITMMALAGSSIHWLARPHLVSWLFILIFSLILNRAADGRRRLLYCLPALMVFWTNLHGGFFVGIALVFTYAVDPLIGALRGIRRFAAAGPFLACAFACVLASFLNPYGLALHQHVFAYLFDTRQVENILEFQSINFRHPLAAYFEFFLAVGALAAFQDFRMRRYSQALLIVVWAHLALVSIRNIPIFLLFAAPSVARALSEWAAQFKGFAAAASQFGVLDRVPRLHIIPMLAFSVLLALMVRSGQAGLLHPEYDTAKYPAKAVEWLRTGKTANIFTDDEWGDYVIYKLFPVGHVFVDGRSDFYGADFESRYLSLMNVRFDWEQDLSNYRVDTALLRVEAPLAGALKLSPHWRVVYDDGIALIFTRAGAAPWLPKDPLLAKSSFSLNQPDQGKDR